MIAMEDILRAVAAEWRLPIETIRGRQTNRNFLAARRVCFWLGLHCARMSQREIASEFGRSTAAGVAWGADWTERMLRLSPELAARVDAARAGAENLSLLSERVYALGRPMIGDPREIALRIKRGGARAAKSASAIEILAIAEALAAIETPEHRHV